MAFDLHKGLFKVALLVSGGLVWSACSSEQSPTGITRKRQAKTQVGASLDARVQKPEAGPPQLAMPDLKGALKASYKVGVKIKGKDGPFGLLNLLDLSPCSGDINLEVNPSLKALETGDISQMLVISSAQPIDCPVIGSKIDIAKILGSVFTSQTNTGGLPIARDGDVLALKSLLGVNYEPSRPIFPSLLAGKKEDLAKLSVTRQVTATSDKGSYTGTCALAMESFDTPYTPPGMSFQFPKSMHFINRMSGFEGLDPLRGLLFDELGFRVSIAPIAITQIAVGGRADKLIPIIASVPEAAVQGLLKSVLPLVKGVTASDGLDNKLVMGLLKDVNVSISIDLTHQDALDTAVTNVDKGETFSGNQTATTTTTAAVAK